MAAQKKAFIVAISGCSSSGKTTLARLLREIFPGAFVLHQDDFYKPEAELPLRNGVPDWDCAGAIDIPAMADTLSHIRQNANLPARRRPKFQGIFRFANVVDVPESTIAALKAKVSSFSSSPSLSVSAICILDGFLLYAPSMDLIQSSLDLKFFLRAPYQKVKERREARSGYVTLDGFWTDPPGYVDNIVWPNYVQDHAWMFEGRDIEGQLRNDLYEATGIRAYTGEPVDADLKVVLDWMVDVVLEKLLRT